jgi:choline dehydrogenase-like flavoprotein
MDTGPYILPEAQLQGIRGRSARTPGAAGAQVTDRGLEGLLIIDGGASDYGALPHADVCIVGSGPAGSALADRLALRGRRVLVVESGAPAQSPWADELNIGEDPYGVGFTFETGRRRAVGGGAALWWGQCVRLEDIDFVTRTWVPHSGWPIGAADLADYYAAAEDWYGVAGKPTAADLDRKLGHSPAFSRSRDFSKLATVFSRRKDQTSRLVERCRHSTNVHLLHSATVIGIAVDGNQVAGLTVRSPGAPARNVAARAYVLAAGGVENARLLLVADRAQGGHSALDPYGLVGRYLQEHPSYFAARVIDFPDIRLQREFGLRYQHRHRFWPKLSLSPKAQKTYAVTGATVALVTRFGADSGVDALKNLVGQLRAGRISTRMIPLVGRVLRDGALVLPQLQARMRGFAPSSVSRGTSLVQVQFEQVPDSANRVQLAAKCDSYGVPLPLVELKVSEQLQRTLRTVTMRLDTELRERRLGRLDFNLSGLVQPDEQWAMASHHAGTTRMSVSPTMGVVDPNCRLHDIANLYVAGSSVFPTSGWANPTLTIVSMAFRLGDELDRQLAGLPGSTHRFAEPG